MLEKIQEMLAEALNISVDKVTADAKIVDDLGADSLDVVELLSRLEEEFFSYRYPFTRLFSPADPAYSFARTDTDLPLP